MAHASQIVRAKENLKLCHGGPSNSQANSCEDDLKKSINISNLLKKTYYLKNQQIMYSSSLYHRKIDIFLYCMHDFITITATLIMILLEIISVITLYGICVVW